MKKTYAYQLVYTSVLCLILILPACKKEIAAPDATMATIDGTPKSLGTLSLYEYAQGVNKRVLIPIVQVGTQKVSYFEIFDTGSTGMTIDATGILPASMITSNGIQFTGDSVNVNGITVTSKRDSMLYGDNTGLTKEYGNLAYAPITIGDQSGTLVTKRIPFFLYYKIVDGKGKQYAPHSSDVFGVGPGVSYASNLIASPLSYFDLGKDVTSGFKLAKLGNPTFSSSGNAVTGLLTVGLVPNDLAASSGFIMHPLTPTDGYSADIPAIITYNNTTITGMILFDTGTPSVTIIEDKTARAIGDLPVNSVVTITTNKGFVYTYTTNNTSNLTAIQNPANTGDIRTVFSLDFFVSNEYLTDYTDHLIGLKNN